MEGRWVGDTFCVCGRKLHAVSIRKCLHIQTWILSTWLGCLRGGLFLGITGVGADDHILVPWAAGEGGGRGGPASGVSMDDSQRKEERGSHNWVAGEFLRLE